MRHTKRISFQSANSYTCTLNSPCFDRNNIIIFSLRPVLFNPVPQFQLSVLFYGFPLLFFCSLYRSALSLFFYELYELMNLLGERIRPFIHVSHCKSEKNLLNLQCSLIDCRLVASIVGRFGVKTAAFQ